MNVSVRRRHCRAQHRTCDGWRHRQASLTSVHRFLGMKGRLVVCVCVWVFVCVHLCAHLQCNAIFPTRQNLQVRPGWEDDFHSKETFDERLRMARFECLWQTGRRVTFQMLCMSSSPDGYLGPGSRTTPDGPNWQTSRQEKKLG